MTESQVPRNMNRVEIPVQGMSCEHCVRRVARALENLPGVEGIQVSLPEGKASLTFDQSRTGIDEARRAIEEAGYSTGPALVEEAVEDGPEPKDQHLGACIEDSGKGTKRFKVGGMTCANCALTIERKLNAIPGVRNASVNFAGETVAVDFDPRMIDIDDIFEQVRDAGYIPLKDREEEQTDRIVVMQRNWLIFSAALSLPIMLLMRLPPSRLLTCTILMLATIAQFSAGCMFYRGAYYSVKNGAANMDVLVALGITASYGYSLMTAIHTLAPGLFFAGPVFFDTSALLITFVRFGKYLEAKARGKAGQALNRLLELQADKARLLVDGEEKEIAAADLKVGDVVVVKPGERIPVDGEIIEGRAGIDESMVTGESVPSDKEAGDKVIGATINLSGSIKIRTTRTGEDTVLSGIIKMVEEAQGVKPPIQRLADSISNYFVPIVVLLSLITFFTWYLIFNAGFVFSFTAATAVMVVACPCALGLATPTAIMVGSGVGLNRGLLFKSAAVLEGISDLQAVGFDKTGTLTKGTPKVTDIIAVPPYQKKDLLQIAASGEKPSIHPLARAVVDRALEEGEKMVEVKDYQEESGFGISCIYQDQPLLIGSSKHLQQQGIDVKAVEPEFQQLAEEGKTSMFVALNGRVIGLIGLADVIKESAREAVTRLHNLGLATFMITGDNKKTARAVGQTIGIGEIDAEILPEDKINIIKKYQQQGLKVAMVGDGINDAPALAQADIGIAIGSGTDAAKETGDVVLVRNDLLDVERAIRLGRMTLKKIKQNFFWALIYNIVGIPVAAGVLYPATGRLLPPEWAGLAMAFSSVSVVANSLRLKSYGRKLLD